MKKVIDYSMYSFWLFVVQVKQLWKSVQDFVTQSDHQVIIHDQQ